LPGAGSGVTFTVTGTVNANSGTLSNTASVSGAGVTDLVSSNNNATDVDTIAFETVKEFKSGRTL